MKYLLVLFMCLCMYSGIGQGIKIFQSNDSTYYGLIKPKIQTLIYKANKGDSFDTYVYYQDRLLKSVLTAKIKSDSIQIVQQQDLFYCRTLLLESNHANIRLSGSKRTLTRDNKKLKRQKWTLVGISAVMAILLGVTL